MDDVTTPPSTSTDRQRTVTVLSVVLTVVGVAAYVAFSDGPVGTRARSLVGLDERVLPAVSADGEGSYAFLYTQRGSDLPVGFSPCRPIEYVVNPAGAPEGWQQVLDEAVAEVERRTGLDLVDRGTSQDRDLGTREGEDDRGDPVLIAWSDEDEIPELAGEVAGVGGPTVSSLGRIRGFVSGTVILDTAATDTLVGSPRRVALHRALLLHELGHLVGLAHVDDPTELMHAEGLGTTAYGPGDLEGLARLGAIPC